MIGRGFAERFGAGQNAALVACLRTEKLRGGFIGDYNAGGIKFEGLFFEEFYPTVGGQPGNFYKTGVVAHNVERLGADRSGRTQNTESFGLPRGRRFRHGVNRFMLDAIA